MEYYSAMSPAAESAATGIAGVGILAIIIYAIVAIIGFILSVLIYLLPTFIALKRKPLNKTAIILINILLGGTVVGWWVSFIMALVGSKPPVYPNQHYQG